MGKNQKVFELVTDIRLRRESFGGLVFVPNTGEIIQINHTGYKLLNHLMKIKKIESLCVDLSFWRQLQERNIVKEII